MKIARVFAALVCLTIFLQLAFAQSGRRATYPTSGSSSSSTSSSDDRGNYSSGNNGTCSDKNFPGEYGNDTLSQRPSNSQSSSTTNANGEEVLKVDTTLVSIPVSVLDRNGKFIPTLSKCDFHIYEDGVRQEVSEFAAVQAPFSVVLLLDTSNSTAFKIEDMHDAAIAFVNQLRSDDKVMVVSFDSSVHHLTDFTSNRQTLISAIRSTHNGGSTVLYDAVEEVIRMDLSRVQGRKAIVLFSDGVDTTSRRASDRSTIDLVEESDVLVYPIEYDTEGDMGARGGYPGGHRGGRYPGGNYPPNGRGGQGGGRGIPPIIRLPGGIRFPLNNWVVPPQIQIGRGRGSSPDDYARAARYMSDLATHSGGTLFRASSIMNVSDAFNSIAEELRHQYSLGYYPTNSNNDGTVRHIKVRVSQTGWVVKAKDSYRASTTASSNSNGSSDRPVMKRRNFDAINLGSTK